MSKEIQRREAWDDKAAELAQQYAGFTRAVDLSDSERLVAVASLVPAYNAVIMEARDSIERLRRENDLYKMEQIYTELLKVLPAEKHENWYYASDPALFDMSPAGYVKSDRYEALLAHVRRMANG